ncbi:helix-turn-helix domain-containing protein [Schleiferilactobacillus shenzhenensis]|uniref:Cytoskeleton protein RodZ-like C-terminal domain-containing protein n=1 Tax=Schleiferilactobacillus shenzhenensis LY-73 TaxID=1231336 RepID=U4TRV1_9LACO|nr:RodZ domain-containing protein [Schleiferilactobacillus shenzhenensis]ERL66180.1 hypothetical protein L248_1272 [Schleiferilactobacillus shenzhenensis LY-73]
MDEVGKKLREARIEKGYTIDDLQQITKIQKRYLIAIEEGNFDALPGDFYVRAFIKQYAETVGLDGQKLLDQYADALPNPAATAAADEEAEEPADKRRDTRPLVGAGNVAARAKNYLPQIIVVAVVVIIIALLSYFAWQGRNNQRSIPTTQESSTSQVAKSSKKSSASSKSSSSAKSSSKKESKKKELKITAAGVSGAQMNYTVANLPTSGNKITVAATSQAVWLSVSFGGTQSWQGTLTAGSDHSVDIPSGTQTIQIRTGNATYTTAKLNDTTIDMNQSGVTSIVRTANLTIGDAASTAGTDQNTAGTQTDASASSSSSSDTTQQ